MRTRIYYFAFFRGEPAIFKILFPLYLASGSPRRVGFFKELGLPVRKLVPPKGTEPEPEPGEDPADYVLRVARAKVFSMPALPPPEKPDPDKENAAVIIGADTAVVLDGRIFGKPENAEHAYAMLSELAGRTHTVLTGCALLKVPFPGSVREGENPKPGPLCFAVETQVTMWRCPQALLRAYAESGEPLDKAGAYAVQGAGAFLIQHLEGSWSNVVGLPLTELIQGLMVLKAIAPLE